MGSSADFDLELAIAARRFMEAVDALHTVHSTTDVHNLGGVAGQAITEHCALICRDTGDRFDSATLSVIQGERPHRSELTEYNEAKSRLEGLISQI